MMNANLLVWVVLPFVGLYCLDAVEVKKDRGRVSINDVWVSKDSTDYSISPYVFDVLQADSMDGFVRSYKDAIGYTLLHYYGKYDSVSNLDSVAAVMSACDFSLKAEKELLPFYIYVFFQALKNKLDGYVGVLVVEKCYELFGNYPGYFYPHFASLKKEVKLNLAEKVAIGFKYRGVDFSQIESIIKKHKIRLPSCVREADTFCSMLEVAWKQAL